MAHRIDTVWLLLIAALLVGGPARADDTRIELIELKGRPAAELIPLLEPVVEPDVAITGSGYKLIVRATPAQQRDIRRLIEQLDKAPRRLLITVQMGKLSQQEQAGGSLHIDKQTGNLGVNIGDAAPPPDPGLTLDQHDDQGRAIVRLHSTRSVSDSSNRQQVQTLEGKPAFIATGSEHPYPARVETWQGPRGGAGGAVDIQLQKATSGFYALVNVRGDEAVVRISPQKESFDHHGGGMVQRQYAETVVSGPVGRWIQVAASGSSTQQSRRAIGRSASTTQVDDRPIWLKVDLVR